MHDYSCNEIFPVDGRFPEITFVDMDIEKTEQIRDVINWNRIALVRGPSKSGKTLLVTHLMRHFDRKRIWIRGGMLHSPGTLWNILSSELKKWGYEELNSDEEKHSIAQIIASIKCVLIVDDFHYIYDKSGRLLICNYLKALNEYQIPIIVIGVESNQLRDVEKSDLKGRFITIELGAWSEEQLKLIGSKGFNRNGRTLLNLELLADESFTSPFLMQLLCKAYCEYKNRNKVLGSIEKVSIIEVQKLLPIVAQQISYMEVYTVLTSGMSNIERRMFLRHDSKSGTFNQMILYAIAADYPLGTWTKLNIHVNRLWQRVKQILHPSEVDVLYQDTSYKIQFKTYPDSIIFEEKITGYFEASLYKMIYSYEYYYSKALYTEEIRNDKAVDLKGQILYISDPFLLFFLRNSLEVEAQFEN